MGKEDPINCQEYTLLEGPILFHGRVSSSTRTDRRLQQPCGVHKRKLTD